MTPDPYAPLALTMAESCDECRAHYARLVGDDATRDKYLLGLIAQEFDDARRALECAAKLIASRAVRPPK